MTRCTSGFCCSSGSVMNSSTESDPELSMSNFLNRLPNLLISSASKFVAISMCKLASFPILIQFWSKQQQQGKNSKNSTILLRQEGTAEDTCVIIEYFLLGRGKTVFCFTQSYCQREVILLYLLTAPHICSFCSSESSNISHLVFFFKSLSSYIEIPAKE